MPNVGVRLSEDEVQALRERAQRNGRTMSGEVRYLLRDPLAEEDETEHRDHARAAA